MAIMPLSVQTVSEEIASVVSQINTDVPFKVDNSTTLVGAEFGSETLIYYMQVAGGLSEGVSPENFKKSTREKIITDACANESVAYFFKNNVSIIYSYTDFEGMPLGKIHLAETDCKP